MELTQLQVNELEKWVEFRRKIYFLKGFSLAAKAGVDSLAEFSSDESLPPEEAEKSLADLKTELQVAEDFHRDAKQLLYAGRQGG